MTTKERRLWKDVAGDNPGLGWYHKGHNHTYCAAAVKYRVGSYWTPCMQKHKIGSYFCYHHQGWDQPEPEVITVSVEDRLALLEREVLRLKRIVGTYVPRIG